MVFPVVGGTQSTGYDIENSMRFNSANSAYFNRTTGTPTNEDMVTISVWLKRTDVGNNNTIMSWNSGNGSQAYLRFANSSDNVQLFNDTAGETDTSIITNSQIKDVAAWYHLVLQYDAAQGTASDRVKIYLNGVLQSLGTANYPPQNTALALNVGSRVINVGRWAAGSEYYNGYMAEFHYLDGVIKDPDDFAKTDANGVWIPQEYTGGSYGNNGFYLEFKQTGTSANSSGIGADTSGNDLHFTVTNLAAQDITTDTCTNNFMTWNPLDSTDPGDLTYSEGNTKVVNATGVCRGTLAAQSGKWYWEIKQITAVDAGNPIQYGIADTEDSPPTHSSLNNALIAYSDNALNLAIKKFDGGTASTITNTMTGFTSISQNDIIMFAFDADTAKLWVGINGTWLNSGDPAAGSNEVASTSAGNFFTPCLEHAGVTYTIETNFGNPPYTVSSTQADDAGYGNFEYDVPAGFYAWCTKNLANHG